MPAPGDCDAVHAASTRSRPTTTSGFWSSHDHSLWRRFGADGRVVVLVDRRRRRLRADRKAGAQPPPPSRDVGQQLKLSARRLIVTGRSLGGALATQAVASFAEKGVVVDACRAYPRWRAFAATSVRWSASSRTIRSGRACRTPTFVQAGERRPIGADAARNAEVLTNWSMHYSFWLPYTSDVRAVQSLALAVCVLESLYWELASTVGLLELDQPGSCVQDWPALAWDAGLVEQNLQEPSTVDRWQKLQVCLAALRRAHCLTLKVPRVVCDTARTLLAETRVDDNTPEPSKRLIDQVREALSHLCSEGSVR